jgi:hypothetical protein
MGKPKDPGYWREYRAAHPEYRERERGRHRQRTPEQRRAERERAKARAAQREQERAEKRAWMRKKRASMSAFERAVEKAMKRFRARMLMHTRAWRGEAREQAPVSRERRALRWHRDADRITRQILSPDRRDVVYDPLFEDARAEALTALMAWRRRPVEERESRATEAVRAFVRDERKYRWYAAYDVYDLSAISPLGVEEVPLDQDLVA